MTSEPLESESPDAPPDSARVARRALILAAMACRSFIEKGAGNPDAESLHGRIVQWVGGLPLMGELHPTEEAAIRTPLGRLDKQVAARGSWGIEGLAVLAWALRLGDFPRHDWQVDPYAVTDAIGLLSEGAVELIATARLREFEELKAARELLYAIHARLRDFLRNREPKDIRHWIDGDWVAWLGIEPGRILGEGDLSIRGEPVSAATEQSVRSSEWAVYEQHHAATWLVGEQQVYCQTTVDT